MQIFGNKSFTRFARKSGITDVSLCKSIRDAERGLIDADLGGAVIKLRIARSGEGKSGGFRTLILFRAGERAIFVHCFAKKDIGNISDDELAAFRILAAEMLNYSDAAIAAAVAYGVLIEVFEDEEAIS